MSLNKKDKHYVYSKKTGDKVIIIIDDYYEECEHFLNIEEQNSFRSPYAYGLYEIWQSLSHLPEVAGFGFFKLCSPHNFDLDFYSLSQNIKNWIDNLDKDNDFRYYILIDNFYGNQENIPIGNKVAIYLDREVKDWHINQYKIAFLSIGGRPASDNLAVEDLPTFTKANIKDNFELSKNLPQRFLYWLDFNEHRLRNFWKQTKNWFSDNEVITHDAPQSISTEYIETIQRVLEFELPQDWWKLPESINTIHNCLKCMCGKFFCGQQEQIIGKRSLSIGSAYLIALMAHYEACDTIENLINEVPNWSNYILATNKLFPLQNLEDAQRSAMSLYDFFYFLFKPRFPDVYSQVNNVFFDRQGQVLKFILNWNPTTKAYDRSQSLAQAISEIAKTGSVKIPENCENTRQAILRLWLSMLPSEEGFMGPGIIYLNPNQKGNKSILTISSIE